LLHMGRTFTDKAIILRRTNFGEADRILSVLTENHGKMTVRAKGVRKITAKLAGHVELLNQSELFLASGKKFYVLAGARNINMYARVREQFGRLALACELAEIVDRNLREGVSHRDVFELLKNSLEYLDKEFAEVSPRQIRAQFLLKPYFIVNFLRCLGYEPQLKNCTRCHKAISWNGRGSRTPEGTSEVSPRQLEQGLRFSYGQGGLLCEDCLERDCDAFEISVDAVKVLRLFLAGRIEIIGRFNLTASQLQEISDVTSRLLIHRLEPPARAEKFSARMKIAGNRV
jgi:DNA repair protein RecO (recombination protein O)